MDDRYAHVKNMRTAIQHEQEAKDSLERYYKKHGYPEPPKPPIREFLSDEDCCPKDGHLLKRKRWWYLWGKKYCTMSNCDYVKE